MIFWAKTTGAAVALYPGHTDVSARLGAAHSEVDDLLGETEQLVVLHGEVLFCPHRTRQTEEVTAILRFGRDHHGALLVDEHGWVHLEVPCGFGHGICCPIFLLHGERKRGSEEQSLLTRSWYSPAALSQSLSLIVANSTLLR
jgi:hypothetical protein